MGGMRMFSNVCTRPTHVEVDHNLRSLSLAAPDVAQVATSGSSATENFFGTACMLPQIFAAFMRTLNMSILIAAGAIIAVLNIRWALEVKELNRMGGTPKLETESQGRIRQLDAYSRLSCLVVCGGHLVWRLITKIGWTRRSRSS